MLGWPDTGRPLPTNEFFHELRRVFHFHHSQEVAMKRFILPLLLSSFILPATAIVLTAPSTAQADGHRHHGRHVEGMAYAEFDYLFSQVSRAGSDSTRTNLIQQAMAPKDAVISSEQVKALFSTFTYDSSRIDALRRCAPRLVDKENGYVILSTFEYSSSQFTAKQILGLK